MKFADVLASSIHDMKNGLGLVINTLDEITEDPGAYGVPREKIAGLRHEAVRLNNNLIELLTLYKWENQRISAAVDEVNVADFLSEVGIENRAVAELAGIEMRVEVDPDLGGYFDEGLIRGVLNNLIENSLRYATRRVVLRGVTDDAGVRISVVDDGSGYSAGMLAAQGVPPGEGHRQGHTQLGIHFAGMVAQLHHSGDRKGHTQLSNDPDLGGACFSLWLP